MTQSAEINNYIKTTYRLRMVYACTLLLHLLITALVWIMAFTLPEHKAAKISPARVILAIIMLVPTGLGVWNFYNVYSICSRLPGDLPSYSWHDKSFRQASINVWIASMSLCIGIFLFIFHQKTDKKYPKGMSIIEVLLSSFNNTLLATALVTLCVAFLFTVGIYIYSLCYDKQLLSRFSEAEEAGLMDEEDGLELNAKDKKVAFVTWFSNVTFTVALIILVITSGGNTGILLASIFQGFVLLLITYKAYKIISFGKIKEQVVYEHTKLVMFHLWFNSLVFNFALGVSLLVNEGEDGFFSAINNLVGRNEAMVWVSFGFFFLMLVLYVYALSLHTSGMWNSDEIDNARLMLEMTSASANPVRASATSVNNSVTAMSTISSATDAA